MDLKNIRKKAQILLLIPILIQTVAVGEARAQFPDPLVAVYDAIAPGISAGELTSFLEAKGVVQKFQPLYSGSFSYGSYISLFWMGEDILQENKIPTSSVVIRVKDQRVICVFYGFYYGEGQPVEKRYKGPCPKVTEI